MKEHLRAETLAAATRVKDLAVGAKDLATGTASDLASGYRKSNRYAKLRAGIVAAWIVLSAGSIWGACPSSGPANALGAEVQLVPASEMLLGTQLMILNDSDRIWTKVAITLDGGWRFEKAVVRPQDKLVVSVSQFEKDGEPAPKDLRPRSVTVECSDGKATTLLGPR